MQAIKLIRIWAILLLPASVLLRPAVAGEPAGQADPTNPPPALKAELRYETGPGQLAHTCAYLTAGTNKFGFVMPDGFRMEVGEQEHVRLVKVDYTCVLSLRILWSTTTNGEAMSAGDCREMLLRQHPGAEIIQEFGLSAFDHSGPAFDLKWRAAGSLARRGRTAFIPFDGGTVEISLESSPESFQGGAPDFNLLLLTLRAGDTNRKLQMPVISNRL